MCYGASFLSQFNVSATSPTSNGLIVITSGLLTRRVFHAVRFSFLANHRTKRIKVRRLIRFFANLFPTRVYGRGACGFPVFPNQRASDSVRDCKTDLICRIFGRRARLIPIANGPSFRRLCLGVGVHLISLVRFTRVFPNDDRGFQRECYHAPRDRLFRLTKDT